MKNFYINWWWQNSLQGSPKNKNNLELWLDGDDASTTSFSGNFWLDKSKNRFNATATGSNRPTFNSTLLNGRGGFTFTSSNKFDLPVIQSFHDSQDLWLIVKNESQATDFGNVFILNGFTSGDASSNRQPLVYQLADQTLAVSHFNTQGDPQDRNVGDFSSFAILRVVRDGLDRKTYRNGTLIATDSIDQDLVTTVNNAIGGGGNFSIVEIILYSTPLVSADETKVTNYLNNKWF